VTGPTPRAPARPVPAAAPSPEVDFATVARLLDDAAVLVRTRGERGEPPARDHRPRIREAISRAAHLARAGTDTDTAQPTARRRRRAAGRRVPVGDRDDPGLVARDWAMVLAAMEINAALGRGRYRDGHDVTAAARTLAGFGLDVGTLGAVNTAADLLAQAARTAGRIAAAAPVPVHRYGQVIAYPLGAVLPADLDTDDIIAVSATPHTAGGTLRLLRIQTATGGARSLLLDTVDGPLSWPEQPTGPDLCVTAWRPVPHRRHPWHSH
jgi:hypothetical protein